MVLRKLQEALTEVRDERRILEEIEQQLRSMISRLSGVSGASSMAEPGVSNSELPDLNKALAEDERVKVEILPSYSDLPVYSELRRSPSI